MDKELSHVLYMRLVFFVCFVILSVIAIRPVFSYDAFWHLQMGKDFLENGLSPWVDHYSFSFLGSSISSVPVIFQMTLYKFVSFFGETNGFYYIKLLYVSLIMLVLYIYFIEIKANWIIALVLLPFLVYFIHIRLMIRPEIFSNVLVIICLFLYLKAKKSFVTKELIYICLLLLFWVNYHSPIIGYIIIFSLFVDKAINKYFYTDESFSWKQWFFWGVVIFLIGFVRPKGEHFLLITLSLMTNDFAKYTQEYLSSYLMFSSDKLVHVSWVLSIYVAVWSLIKKQYGFVILVVLLTYYSWTTVRLLTVAMLINLCILALYFSQSLRSKHLFDIRTSVKSGALIVVIGVTIFSYYSLAKVASISLAKYENKERLADKRYPVQMADYLKTYQQGGNVLNAMMTGGFLINKLSPEFKIYFDGRTNILYPIEFLEKNLTLLKNTEQYNETIDDNNVKYALFENDPITFFFLSKSNKVDIIFADENYLLFSSESNINAFPYSSKLLVSPLCWNDEWVSNIITESDLSDELFADKNYTIKPFLVFIRSYIDREDKVEFFDKLQVADLSSDPIRRMALYLAFNTGDIEKASEIFNSIIVKNEYDILMYAYQLAINHRYEDAENVLYYFYKVTKFVKKKAVTYDKMTMMVRILDVLQDSVDLRHFEVTYKAELEDKLKAANYDVADFKLFDHDCM